MSISVGSPDGGAPPDAGAPDAPVNTDPPPSGDSGGGVLDTVGDWLGDRWEDVKQGAGQAADFVEKHWDTIVDGAHCVDAVKDKDASDLLEKCKEFGESLGKSIYDC
jgi:hypothetical protein